ncbi:MAG: HEPN domain-containing protein [Armatimonadetes bacterium]|nr:HEPN domain-containing protein [Armatimonadota bacterium]
MSGDPLRPDIVGDWLAKANADLKTARQIASFGESADTCAVCFHAQQAAEKSLKALLVNRGLEPPRTHDLTALAELLPDEIGRCLDLDALDALTSFAVGARYPGPFEEPSLARAIALVGLAGGVLDVVTGAVSKVAASVADPSD